MKLNRLTTILIFPIIAVLTVPVFAQEETNPDVQSMLEQLAPYLAKSTILVVSADLEKINLGESFDSLKEIVDTAIPKTSFSPDGQKSLAKSLTESIDWMKASTVDNKFFEKIGCQKAYVLVDSMTMGQSPLRIICQFDPGKTKSLGIYKTLLDSVFFVQEKDDLLILDLVWFGSTPEQRTETQKLLNTYEEKRKAVTRSEFADALNRTRSAPVKIAFVPDAAIKGMVQFAFMATPKGLQEIMDANTVLDAANWVSLGADPNRWILDLNIKGESPHATQNLYDSVLKLKDWTIKETVARTPANLREDVETGMKTEIDKYMKYLPKVQEDRLRLTVDPKFIEENLPTLLEYFAPQFQQQ